MPFGRTGFGGAGLNGFAPNNPHVFNSTFRFNQFGFNRFGFNRFGFLPTHSFFFPHRNFFFFNFGFFPGFGFFGSPWWWGPGWAWSDPSWQWGWPSPPPTAWGSSVYESNPELSGSSSTADAENHSTDINESEVSPDTNPTTGDVAVSTPSIWLYLKDGTMHEANDYWFAGSKLHFIVNGAGERTIGMDELDLQRTVDENAKRGVSFTLKQNKNDSNTTPNKSDSSPGPAHPPAPPIESASQP
jgi:hypothetical protein